MPWIFDVEGELGDKLCLVHERLYLVIEAMESIQEKDWAEHMDDLHRLVERVRTAWEYVELKEAVQ